MTMLSFFFRDRTNMVTFLRLSRDSLSAGSSASPDPMVKRVHFPRYSRNVAMSTELSGKLRYSPRFEASATHNSYARPKTTRGVDAGASTPTFARG